MELLLARQPIFDRAERVVAYALLHHGAATADETTAERLLVDAVLGSGLEQLTGGRRAHLKASPGMLTGDTVRLLDPRQLTLELAADAAEAPGVIDACAQLAHGGYELALDGFVPTPATTALLPTVRTVKVDVRGRSMAELVAIAEHVRPRQVRLLAEHAEHRGVRDVCLHLGFELFQGCQFARPETLVRRDLPIQHVQTFKLLKALRDPDVHESLIEDGFRRDVALSYKLLRMVNSAAMGGRGIWSIGHAVRLLGRQTLYRWLSLLLLQSVSDGGVHAELLYASLLRARLLELLAHDAGMRPAAGPLFLVGVFSMLDALMGQPMADVVTQLDVDEEVAAALEHRTGFFGAMLGLAEAYESGRWDEVARHCDALGVTAEMLSARYVESLGWARERVAQLSEPLTATTTR